MTLEGAEATKQVILNRLYEKVEELGSKGCSFGAVTNQKTIEHERRLGDLETKFFWIIALLITNLTATVISLLGKGPRFPLP